MDTDSTFWDFVINLNLSSVEWLEWAKALFDLVKGIAWPLALFMIVWVFRNQLRERIRDLISVGPTGAVLQPPSQQQTVQSIVDLSAVEIPLQSARPITQRIENEMQDVPQTERYHKLVVALAVSRLERAFEWVFSIIFGSQILALRHLSTVEFVTTSAAEAFFHEKVVPINPEFYSNVEYWRWNSFLVGQQLVKIEGNHVSITELGRDFLLFVDVNKPNESRPS